MASKKVNPKIELARVLILSALLTLGVGAVLTKFADTTPVRAFSSGPPPAYTGAPGEEPEACAECHVPPDAGTGRINITAPQTYTPGQAYPITVTHTNADPTRLRWGFELTALDSADEKAGNLQPLDGTTQVIDNAGPGNARQYIEHTAVGTFVGQQNGASWTFNWIAPATDVGPVTFYTAGNHANNDGNTSGDYIYRTFVTISAASATPDYGLTVSPAARTTIAGGTAQYTVSVTPLAGFTGLVNLSASGLPSGVTAGFNPTAVNITDATTKTSTITLSTTGSTPVGNYAIDINGQSGSLIKSSSVSLRVVSPTSVDLSVTKTASPNPSQVGVNLAYRVTVTNDGPALATNVNLVDTLPALVTFGSATPTQGTCAGTTSVNCNLGSIAVGSSAVVTIVVVPTTAGQVVNTATVTATETDFEATNNTSSITTPIQPAAPSPTMVDPNLTVSTVITGLNQPTTMAFIGPNQFLVLERTTGKVQRVVNGSLDSTALDLPVNGFSERGLLGIAVHPRFSQNGFVYLFWTESSIGQDTVNPDEVAVLGNRVDRYIWNGAALVFDRNLIRFRAVQQDAGQPSRGNHNGGVLRFGPDEKLYIIFGDQGRRGLLQNIVTGGPVPDDQFGGPEPDDAHLSGVIIRLNDDGSTPSDNPFFNASTSLSGESAANLKKIFAYGVRNSFGMAFDPLSGALWTQENGDDAFDEINRVTPGFNGGWIQTMGPVSRVSEFKAIESTYGAGNLQQLRWPPSNIASTPSEAISRMFMLPGAQYVDPEFSWKYALAPSPIGFVRGRVLGPQFEGDLFVGASRTTLLNGYLFRFKLASDRLHFSFTDSRLADRIADNTDKFDQTESESLVIGRDFGVTTDIQTGPNGNAFVVSLSNGAVYEIKSKPSEIFFANLTGSQEVPANNSTATGTANLILSPDGTFGRLSLSFQGLTSPQSDAHIHGPAPAGTSAPVLFPLPLGQVNDFQIALTPAQLQNLRDGLLYVNVHSSTFPTGEIRGQFQLSPTSGTVGLGVTSISVNESEQTVSLNIFRNGNVSNAASVNYATTDGYAECNVVNGQASAKCDYATAGGTLQFAAGETSKTILVSIINDGYVEGNETFTLSLSNGSGVSLGSPSTTTVTITDNDATASNPFDTNSFFVRQQYLDFLLREPDTGGFNDWLTVLNNCNPGQGGLGSPAGCDRVHVSSGFFRSTEFGERGYWSYRYYHAVLGRRPQFAEFVPDMRRLSGSFGPGEEEAARAAFVADFMQRPEFTAIYAGLTNAGSAAQFIAKLEEKAQVTLPATVPPTQPGQPPQYGRAELIQKMQSGQFTAAQTLRAFIEQKVVFDAFFFRAFVAMQYFGYLLRDPEQAGYDDWVDVLTNGRGSIPAGDFRHLIFGFIYSVEYRQRFGPP